MERFGILDEHNVLVKTVLKEAEYNKTPGIGDERCPFRLDGHYKLLSSTLSKILSQDVLTLLREITRGGGLCNGGRIGGAIVPGTIKREKRAAL